MKKFLVYYFLFLIFFLSIFCSGVMDSQDGLQYLAVARNIYYTGKPTAPIDEYNQPIKKNIPMGVYIGKDGNTYGATGLGYSLALLPAVAITDIFYKIYDIKPAVHFPLENDWLILLTASFTNIFFASGLAVILFLYFIELGLSKKQALIMSLVAIFATNLFVYAKNSFAHMMFITFLTLSFFLVRKYFSLRKTKYLIFAGMSFGVVTITYNSSFLFAIPPLILYFLLLQKPKLTLTFLKALFRQLWFFFIGILPFVFIFFWFENTRSGSQGDPGWYASYAKKTFFSFPISMFIEGVYGQILSPGRSIFIYTPMLLMIIFFWHKIKKNTHPEFFVLLLLMILYVPLFALQITWGDGGALGPKGYAGLWHGESSWGPRYLLILLPFGLLVIGGIYKYLNKFQKYFIFLPLILAGFYVEILGVIMPYQIKTYNLERNFYVNETEFTSYVYTNLMPRYTPILSMSKNLIKLPQDFLKTFDHGKYNVKLYDGIYFPFNVGWERWRVIEGRGHISFENLEEDPLEKMYFGLINHPILESSSSAKVQFSLNDQPLLEKPSEFALSERKIVEVPINAEFLKDKSNELLIDVNFTPSIKEGAQIFSLISFTINNHPVNLETLDFPYVSSLGSPMGAKYQNYGKEITDPWKFWDLHTQIYERTPDFWWIKTFYYWDYPKKAMQLSLGLIVILMIYFGFKTFKNFKSFN